MTSDTKIKIKPAAFKGSELWLTPAWVSNGAWAVKRDIVPDIAPFLTTAETAGAWAKVRVCEQKDDLLTAQAERCKVPWTVTPWLCDVSTRYRCRVLRHEQTGAIAFLQDAFCTMLGAIVGDVVLGDDDRKPGCFAAPEWLCMAVCADETPLTLMPRVRD